VLINHTLALRYWPSAAASLGQRIYTMRGSSTRGDAMTIVGVTGDVKDSPTDTRAQAVFYQPFLQNPSFGNYVAVRATADVSTLIPAIRQVTQQMGNDLSIQEIRPLEQVVAEAVATERFALQVVGIFAAVALALAFIGIYGVMSYAAGRRAREIAIRVALGAGPADTVRALVGPGVRWIAAGLMLGGLAAAELTRVFSSILYQVGPRDFLTFAAVPVILATAGAIACYSPARRALRIDPIEALRHE
ncbi:MAG TPA: FtsX-like permease family protein, partial [Bryobacteraceae bacterium]